MSEKFLPTSRVDAPVPANPSRPPSGGPPEPPHGGGGGGYGPPGGGHGGGYGPPGGGYGPPGGGYGPPGGYGGYGEEGGTNQVIFAGRTMQDYLSWMTRYAWLIVLTTVAGSLAGYYFFSITPKKYKSWATIEIQRLKQEAAEVDVEERLRLGQSEEIQSTLEKLRMPRIYQAVAGGARFVSDPAVIPATPQHRLPWMEKTEVEKARGSLSPEVLASMMTYWFELNWRPNTNLVDIYATHTDPKVARDLVQALLSEYETLTEEAISGSEKYAMDYIMEKAREVKAAIVENESKLSRYQGCLDLSARIRQADAVVTEMEKRYLPGWPELIEAKELVTLLRAKFAEELSQVLNQYEDETQFWALNSGIMEDLQGDEKVSAQLKVVASRSNMLAKDLEADRGIFENLTVQLKEADVSRGFTSKQFAIIQPPTLPGSPSAPRLSESIAIFVGGGLMSGLALVFLFGYMDQSLRTVGELETLTHIPVVGAIPGRAGKKRPKGEASDLVLISKSDAHSVEAIRTLRAGLTYLGDQEERCSFVITSALASEGKSWVAANLAVGFAQQGDRTVLIDGDLRKSVQSVTFETPRDAPGITDYLALGKSLGEVTHATQVENLWIIPAGGQSANPAELLGSKNLRAFIAEVTAAYDRVIIDSAPLVPVSDTLALAKLAQSVLICYRTGKTPRNALLRALKMLRANRTEPVGIIANLLPRAKTRGSYGYYYSYYGGGNVDGYYDAARK